MLFKRNKNKTPRSQRVEIYKGAPKKRAALVFRVRSRAGNVPAHYANEVYGRPEKNIYISFTKILLVILLLAGIAYVALFSNVFKIKKIIVVNNQILLESDVVKFLEDRNVKNKNLFLINSNQVRSVLIDYYKRIDDVRVYKVFPAQLKIKIQEKPTTLIWQTGERKYLLDNQGVVISEVKEDVKMPIVVDLAQAPVKTDSKIVATDFIDFVNIVDESLKKRFGLNVVNYSITQTTFELRANVIKDKKPIYIIFDTTADASEQLDKLAKIYQQGEKINEYVILSVNGRVIVK
ncbi:MAG TPA: FtsQ-type POTRA domain-containing protein [Patescibacteria group bacterium]|nr:FtsQ-type POTRA domain-containing protein [Patescibacteria group bacterium]